MPVVLILLAVAWAAFVVAAVVGSAPSGGASIVALDREIATPGTPEGVWILCALAVSAGLALAWAFGSWNRRRHRVRLHAELDERWALRSHESVAEQLRGRLMESRERELDEVIWTLTAQRDALLEEIAELRANAPDAVRVPDTDDTVVDVTDGVELTDDVVDVVDVTDDVDEVDEVDRAG
jgi:hypothetical protein